MRYSGGQMASGKRYSVTSANSSHNQKKRYTRADEI